MAFSFLLRNVETKDLFKTLDAMYIEYDTHQKANV